MDIIDVCICGTNTDTACEAGHWNTPTGATVVAFSCSPECMDATEALRRNGRLTTATVVKARAARHGN